MAINIGDVLRVAVSWIIDDVDQIVNVHMFQVAGVGSNSDPDDFLDDLVTNVLTAFYSEYDGAMSDNIAGYLVNAYDIMQDLVIAPVANPVDGTNNATDTTAHQLTPLVCWNGPNTRRQGRCYLPPTAEGAVTDNGLWEASMLATLASFGARALDIMTGDQISVYRVISDKDALVSAVPTSVVIPTAPRTQRRRTIGRGS